MIHLVFFLKAVNGLIDVSKKMFSLNILFPPEFPDHPVPPSCCSVHNNAGLLPSKNVFYPSHKSLELSSNKLKTAKYVVKYI
jgi:hypothetical protein